MANLLFGDSLFYLIYFIDYYDLNGLRIKKIINCEYNADRNKEVEIIKYYYEGNRLITEYKDENNRLDFLYDNNGILYGFIENKTNIYYYVRDCMQNILGIIESNNNLIVKYNYNAYGELLSITGNTYIGNKNPFKYKGYYYDNESGFFWCNSRYYNPEWCRWLTPDGVEYLESDNINGLNLYCYCGNNPVMYVDPSGHSAISINWFNLGNTFDLTATLAQLIVGGAAIGGQYAVLNAVKPSNIGIGL